VIAVLRSLVLLVVISALAGQLGCSGSPAAPVDALIFMFCSMAAASDGSIYLQTFQQLWKVSP
jgi:hypothetical protein